VIFTYAAGGENSVHYLNSHSSRRKRLHGEEYSRGQNRVSENISSDKEGKTHRRQSNKTRPRGVTVNPSAHELLGCCRTGGGGKKPSWKNGITVHGGTLRRMKGVLLLARRKFRRQKTSALGEKRRRSERGKTRLPCRGMVRQKERALGETRENS